MRRAAWLVPLLLAVPPAWGDPESSGPPGAKQPPKAEQPQKAEETADDPWLDLDPVLQSRLVGFGAVESRDGTDLALGPDTRLVLEGTWWSNEDDDPRHPVIDSPGRGWQAGMRLSHDAGLVLVGASASINQLDVQLGRGRYLDVGLSLTRTFRLSRWMTAWISLGVGHRRWSGQAPAEEPDGAQIMLTIGTTFR